MKWIGTLVLLFLGTIAVAQGPFDGTWRIDTQQMQAPPKTDEYQVGNGRYVCSTCSPKVDIKADGEDQKLMGNPYADAVAVKVIDDHNIEEIAKKAGVVAGTTKFSVSDDNNTLTQHWSFTNSNGKSGQGTTVLTRVGPAPKSGNMVSGQWRIEKFPDYSDNVGVFTFKSSAEDISYSAPTGENYTAKADGKDYPYNGDPGTTSVVLNKIDERTLEEVDKRDGKPVSVTRMTVSEDGKSMVIAVDDKLHNQQWKWVAQKQENAVGN